MSDEAFCRYLNRDMVYNTTTKKFTLTFDVESTVDKVVDDKDLIILAVDAIAGLIEDNDADPFVLMTEILKLRESH